MGTENDAESAAAISENASKFTQDTFIDSETGITLEYSLYVPENYNETENYPLLMYIPDSTAVGKSALYYGNEISKESIRRYPFRFLNIPEIIKKNFQGME